MLGWSQMLQSPDTQQGATKQRTWRVPIYKKENRMQLRNTVALTAHIQKRQPNEYDKAVSLLIDLHDLAVRKQRVSEFQSALEEFRQAHTAKQSFLRRLAKADL